MYCEDMSYPVLKVGDDVWFSIPTTGKLDLHWTIRVLLMCRVEMENPERWYITPAGSRKAISCTVHA